MREFPVPGSQFPVLQKWLCDLRDFVSSMIGNHTNRRPPHQLADTTDEGMVGTLSGAIAVRPGSRWDRAAVRATIGLHATRLRDAGVSGEQGLARFKELMHRAAPLDPVRADEQARSRREMVRWWIEAYYEPDV
jgi:hypothetical protein